MFRALLAGTALVLGTGAATPTTTRTPAAFSLMLESTVTGWAARCDSGCRWEQFSLKCAHACSAFIDATGVNTVATPRFDSSAFRFRVERTTAGVRATAQTGTAWQALAWTCRLNPCRAHVDAYGVSGIDLAR